MDAEKGCVNERDGMRNKEVIDDKVDDEEA